MSKSRDKKTQQIFLRDEKTFAISGELSFETVPLICEEAKRLLHTAVANGASGTWSLSLASLSRSDSAGLALLIDCLREAKSLGIKLQFIDLPSSLKELMEISGLDAVLPIVGAS